MHCIVVWGSSKNSRWFEVEIVWNLNQGSTHPQRNGQCKHFNCNLHLQRRRGSGEVLRGIIEVVFAYNTSEYSSTGYTEYLMFGCILNLPVDILLVVAHKEFNKTADEWIYTCQRQFKVFFEVRLYEVLIHSQCITKNPNYPFGGSWQLCRGEWQCMQRLEIESHSPLHGKGLCMRVRWSTGENSPSRISTRFRTCDCQCHTSSQGGGLRYCSSGWFLSSQ